MNYYMGIDLARKTDWTVATVIDSGGHVVAAERFHQISWSLQVGRVAELYRLFRCVKATCDSTGLGDVVIEQLEAQGLTIEPYIFTVPSRKALLEELILAFDNCEITLPATERFAVFRAELEAFEFQLDGTTMRYAAAPGQTDDCVMSLALAWHACRGARSSILGVLEWGKRIAREVSEGVRNVLGELIQREPPKPKPAAAPAPAAAPLPQASSKPAPELLPFCSKCKNIRLVKIGSMPGRDLHCNTCGADHDRSGNLISVPATSDVCPNGPYPGAPHSMTQWAGGRPRCQFCGFQPGGNDPTNGLSRSWHNSQLGFRRFLA